MKFRFKISQKWQRTIKQRPFLFFGLPFVSLIVGGSFLLTELTKTRYEIRDNRTRKVVKEYCAFLNVELDNQRRRTKHQVQSSQVFHPGRILGNSYPTYACNTEEL